MKPEKQFLSQPKHFWANVRTISQQLRYTTMTKDPDTGEKISRIKIPKPLDMQEALQKIGLSATHIVDANGQATEFGELLSAYFEHRERLLTDSAKPNLMDARTSSLRAFTYGVFIQVSGADEQAERR